MEFVGRVRHVEFHSRPCPESLAELGDPADRFELAATENGDPVGDRLDLFEDVTRKEHGRAAVGFRRDDFTEPPSAVRIEPGGGFVENEKVGPADERDSDRHPLTHPLRVAAGAAVGGLDESDAFEQLAGIVVGILGHDGMLDVLVAGEARVCAVAFEKKARSAADRDRLLVGVVAEDANRAAAGRREVEHGVDRGRLARAVRPQKAEHLAGFDRQR